MMDIAPGFLPFSCMLRLFRDHTCTGEREKVLINENTSPKAITPFLCFVSMYFQTTMYQANRKPSRGYGPYLDTHVGTCDFL